jgi:signal transduction histidine kinase
LVGASALIIWEQYIKASDTARHTSAVMSEMQHLMADLLDAESSSRGYLLSGNEEVLAHFKKASEAARRRSELLASVRSETAQQAQALRELNSATEAKLDRLSAIIAVARPVTPPKGISREDMQRGEALVARVRAAHERAQQQFQELLQKTRRRSRFLARLSEGVATLGCAGIFAFILFAQVRIQRLAASGVKLNDELISANEDLRDFVYSASHDLQEPLRVLMLYSDLVKRNLEAGRTVTNELRHLRGAAKQMSALLVDLVTYTQLLSEPTDAHARSDLGIQMQNVLDQLRPVIESSQANVCVEELPVVRMENSHALLLLRNLIENSLTYRRRDVPLLIAVSAKRSGGKWVISVSDNGIGIEGAYQQYIFGIFKRLHTRTLYPGTGLGLAICRRIVERYGGTIWVNSEADKGSTFSFSVAGGEPS